MKVAAASSRTNLDALIADLHAHDVVPPPDAYARLRHVLRMQPQFDKDELRVMLGCALAPTPRERELFEAAFARWVRNSDWELSARANEQDRQRHGPGPGPGLRPTVPGGRKRASAIGWSVFVGLVILVIVWWAVSRSPAESDTKTESPAPTKSQQRAAVTEPKQRPTRDSETGIVTSYRPLAPNFVTVPALRFPGRFGWLLLGLGSAFALSLLLRRYHARRSKPEFDPDAPLKLDPNAWLPRVDHDGVLASYLDRDDVRSMVWGVGRFVADDELPRLDLDRTVAATARAGGSPVLIRQRATYPRDCWLWIDRAAAAREPSLRAIADEVVSSLVAAGLPVRIGEFYDVPDQIEWDEPRGTVNPLTLEGHRQHALVAILTDGRGIAFADDHALRRERLGLMLRNLASWPHLGFFDFGRGAQGLVERLRPFGLSCAGPEELPRFFGGEVASGSPRRRTLAARIAHDGRLAGATRAWAAALAMGGGAFDVHTAHAVHRRLGLRVPLQAFSVVRRAAQDLGGMRWQFDDETRIELLDWLGRAEREERDGRCHNPPDGWLARSLAFQDELTEMARARRGQARVGSADQAKHEVEHETDHARREITERFAAALRALWFEPDRAADELERLVTEHDLVADVRAALQTFTPRSSSVKQRLIELPWRFDERTPEMQMRLHRLGLTVGRALRSRQRMPARLAVAFGLLAGITLGSLDGGLFGVRNTEPTRVGGEPPYGSAVFATMPGGGGAVGLAGMVSETMQRAEVEAGSDWSVEWAVTEESRPNPEVRGEFHIYRRGTLGDRPRPAASDWPRRSLAMIVAPIDHQSARDLAVRLWDWGAADVVAVGPSGTWDEMLGSLAGGLPRAWTSEDQLLVFSPEPVVGRELIAGPVSVGVVDDFAKVGPSEVGVAPAEDVWPDVNWVTKGALGFAEVIPAVELEFASIPAGTFTMGSPSSEHNRDSSDENQFEVSLSAFELSTTEIPRQVWIEVMGSRKSGWPEGSDDLPANDVSWIDAIKFCNALSRRERRTPCYELDDSAENPEVVWKRGADGYRLPTEAEWEYACRAGTTTPFSFGETITTEQANFDGNYPYREGDPKGEYREKVVAVGSLPANAWGLHEMHGNVREWCWDWYAQYPTAPQTDPAGPEKGSRRVLRGGSFVSAARGLRSAYRLRFHPGAAGRHFGFRCVRPARRQR